MVYFSNTFGLGLDDLFAQTHDKILLIAVVLGKKKKKKAGIMFVLQIGQLTQLL